jgi:hypothetical protein
MKTSYNQLLQQRIEIPIIQRDYAQGRKDGKTSKIRRDFLDVIFETLEQRNALELDFIYGLNEAQTPTQRATFVPIDGQQRLTTLWLLYWLVAAKEGIASENKQFLAHFVYETRHSTTVFCEQLVHFAPQFDKTSIAKEIRNQAWYFNTWEYDPSIQAMLVMLEALEIRYEQLTTKELWPLFWEGDGLFYFYKLDMKEVGMSDDLYIKMNSRGKALTEFEYFKAGFATHIQDEALRRRFEQSVDGIWMDAIWALVKQSKEGQNSEDLALLVDAGFLSLFDYLTNILALQQEVDYLGATVTPDLLPVIYKQKEALLFLFELLDAVCQLCTEQPNFWKAHFYYNKDNFEPSKVRLYFTHEQENLLQRCLLHARSFSFPEQLLLYACLVHVRDQSTDFETVIRSSRNLVVNSENELRREILGQSFQEIERLTNGNTLEAIKTFKTEQLEEEKRKRVFLANRPAAKTTLLRLEDSDLLRGAIALLEWNEQFKARAEAFLTLFDEELNAVDFLKRFDVLLCFGDYAQRDKGAFNLLAPVRRWMRRFFTAPGYGKHRDIFAKTQPVLMRCLDYFVHYPKHSMQQVIEEHLALYEDEKVYRDWRYYFLNYPSFRERNELGYYNRWSIKDRPGPQVFYKMRKKQFQGFSWDPFLYEVAHYSLPRKAITLENYYAPLEVRRKGRVLHITSVANGFLFEAAKEGHKPSEQLVERLIQEQLLNEEGILVVTQNEQGMDKQDRISLLVELLEKLLENNSILLE